jgi:hypothetical protein
MKSKSLFYPELNASRLKSSKKLGPGFTWEKPSQENKTGIPGFGINTKAMVSDFAFEARRKEDDARNALRKESQKVENIRKGIVEAAENNTIGKIGKPSFFNKKTGETTDGYFAKDAKEGKIGLMDSILNKSESDLLIRKYGMSDGYGFGFAGAACNTHACALQRMGGAEVTKDFSFRRRVDGKQINLKEGDAPPTLPNNTDMDNIYPKIGYQHVALHDTKKSALSKGRFSSRVENIYDFDGLDGGKTGVSGEEAKKRYDQTVEGVDEILPGDNLRSNFYPHFFKDGSMYSGVGHSMTVGNKNPYGGFNFYENSGQVLSGLRINNNVWDGGKEGVYLRYVGKTPKLKKNLNTASFIVKNTKKPIQPASIKTTSNAKITGNTKGINSLVKKLKKK